MCFTVCLLFAGGDALSQSEIFSGIIRTDTSLIPLSIRPFQALDGARRGDATNIEQLVTSDLKFSGIFKIVQGGVPLATNGRTEGLIEIRGLLSIRGGETYFEGRVLDVSSGQSIGAKRYKVRPKQTRQVAHHFADEVVRLLTGELGIATTKIIYRRQKAGKWEVVISDYDGYNPRVVLRQSVPILYPRWIDHSRGFAYTSFRNGKPDLFTRYLKEPKSKPIASFDGLNYSVDWSEKRKEMVATLSKDGNAEIYILSKNGKVKRRLTHARSIDCSPSWSPTGREVLFTSDRTGSPQLYVMEANGSNVRRLTYQGSYSDTPAWSRRRGEVIVFASRFDGFFQLCTIRPDGTDFRRLTFDAVNHEDPRWAPNGRHVVYVEERGREKVISIIDIATGGKRILAKGETPDWSQR